MDQNLKEEVIKEVVKILMEQIEPESKSEQSVSLAIKRNDGHRAATYTIVNRMGLSQATVDWIVNRHIEKYQKSLGRGRFLEDTDPLSDVLALIYCGASKEVIEKVIGLCVRKGWYGRTEGMCRDLLGRDLNPEEIHALVDAYVNNRASRSTTQEEYLIDLAERCLDAEGARAVRMKVDGFIAEWNRHTD